MSYVYLFEMPCNINTTNSMYGFYLNLYILDLGTYPMYILRAVSREFENLSNNLNE